MKWDQLEMGNVRARLWRLNLGFITMFLLAFAVACGSPAPIPTVTPTPTPTPTATPAPTPTPTATPTPPPALITEGPGDNPQAFLQAIPASERDCVVQAFGTTENLLELIATGPPSAEDMAKLNSCLSEETARRMMLGVMTMELGISEQAITCMSAELGDVSFLALYGQEPGEQSTQAQTFGFQIFRAAFDCLSEEEAAEMFGSVEEGGGPSMDQFKCLFESADDETILRLFVMSAGASEGAPLPPELLDIITRCGPIPGPSEGSGPPELTPEQQSCFIEAIGETAFSELFTGQRPPTFEEVQEIEACGVLLGPG